MSRLCSTKKLSIIQLTSRYLSSPNPHFPCSSIRPNCRRMFGSRILEVSNLEARRQLKHSNFDAKFCCSFMRLRLKSVAFVANFHSAVATLKMKQDWSVVGGKITILVFAYRLHVSAASWSNSRRNWTASPRLSLDVFDTTQKRSENTTKLKQTKE